MSIRELIKIQDVQVYCVYNINCNNRHYYLLIVMDIIILSYAIKFKGVKCINKYREY